MKSGVSRSYPFVDEFPCGGNFRLKVLSRKNLGAIDIEKSSGDVGTKGTWCTGTWIAQVRHRNNPVLGEVLCQNTWHCSILWFLIIKYTTRSLCVIYFWKKNKRKSIYPLQDDPATINIAIEYTWMHWLYSNEFETSGISNKACCEVEHLSGLQRAKHSIIENIVDLCFLIWLQVKK